MKPQRMVQELQIGGTSHCWPVQGAI